MPNPIDPGLLARLMGGQVGPMGYINENGTIYQPLGNMGGNPDTGYQFNPSDGYMAYDANKTQPGDATSFYNPQGEFTNEGQIKDMSGFDPLLAMFLAAAGDMAAFLPGGFAAGAGASGAGAGGIGATVPTEAAWAASQAGLESSLAPYLAGGAGGADARARR